MERPTRMSEPPDTDLDYYARPENYRGSNLKSFTRILLARNNVAWPEKTVCQKQIKGKEEKELFIRYGHLLPSESSDMFTTFSIDGAQEDVSRTDKTDECLKMNNAITGKKHLEDELHHHAHGQQQMDPDPLLECAQVQTSFSLHDQRSEDIRDKEPNLTTTLGKNFKPGQKSDHRSLGSCTSTPSPDFRSRLHLTRSSAPATRRPSAEVRFSSATNRMNSQSREHNLISQSRQDIRTAYLVKFKKVTLAVVNVLKLAKAIIKRTDSPSALLKSFTTMSREPETEDQSENMKNYGLQFDPSYFRANREISISSEVKSILRLPPSHRSPEQIQTAMFGLQSLPSFAEYPLHMQEKLAKVAWYEIVTPMRTIIRQGHYAENFYFILAGQAVVTIGRPGETATQTAAILRKGTSFGELALLHHSKRTATVTSHDTVQLLSVGREDFFDIFMSGHGKELIPEHIKFISQLEFMKDWPLQRLLERPDQCLLHFFKRNMVIVKNSITSDWLYIVKSGSCQVLKQLKAVTGSLGVSRKQSLTARPKSNRHQTRAWYQGQFMIAKERKLRNRGPLRHVADKQTPEKEEHTTQGPQEDVSDGLSDTSSPDITLTSYSKSHYSGAPKTSHPHFGRDVKAISNLPQVQTTLGLKQEQNNSQNDQQQLQQPQEHRPQLPVFVQIELLKPKDVFGLDLVNFNSNLDTHPPSVSLVSLGAECIMLSKAFFMKHANDHIKKRFSEIIHSYPDEDTLQNSLQTKVNWELYKHSLIVKIISTKKDSFRQSVVASS